VLPKAGRSAGVQSQRLVESAMLVLLVLPLLRVSIRPTPTNRPKFEALYCTFWQTKNYNYYKPLFHRK
jgi:hypothetical protein